MAGPWEKFSKQEDGPWARFSSSAPVSMIDQIPGMAVTPQRQAELDEYEKRKKAEETPLKMVQGFLEPLAVAGSGAIAGVGALPYAGVQKLAGDERTVEQLANKFAEDITYQPRTLVGEKLTKDYVNPVFENLAALGLSAPTSMAGIAMSKPKAVKGPVSSSRVEALKAKLNEEPVAPTRTPEQMELPLENNPQQIAEMQNRGTGQLDMFAPVNEPQAAVPRPNMDPMNPVRPIDTMRQHELFDQSEQGRMANPYEAATGDWRVDENGMPIKADLSMELQNLENPLQRNLWGDELPPTKSPLGQGLQGVEDGSSQMGIPLTEAIDSMPDLPWKTDRDVGIAQLTGELEAPGRLQSAVAEANGPWTNYSQRGAVNLDAFRPGFERKKRISNDIELVLRGTRVGPEVQAVDKDGNIVGQLSMNKDNMFAPVHEGSNLEAAWVSTDPKKIGLYGDRNAPTAKSPHKGLSAEMYKFASEVGDIVRSEVQTPEGAAMWNKFANRGLGDGKMIRMSERGAVDPDLLTFGLASKLAGATEPKSNPLASASTDSAEYLKGKADNIKAGQQNIAAKLAGIEGYRDNITTPEQVLALTDAKDITPAQRARGTTVTSGVNNMVINTEHPLLKFMRATSRKVWQESEQMTKQYITNKETGIRAELDRMKQADKNEVTSALMEASKAKKPLTRDMLEALGFSEDQVKFVEKYYEMEKAKLDVWNENRVKVGMDPVTELPGHMPGIFSGDYKQLVYSTNPDRSKKLVHVITTDTRYGLKSAREAVLKQYPDATFSEYTRQKLGGNRARSDLFSGVRDILDVLAKNDPEFAKIQEMVSKKVSGNADALYAAHLHALDKKGIGGSEGQKPWKDVTENTNDFWKAYFRHWEDGIISHKNLSAETQFKALLDNPLTENWPNAKQYANKYWQNMTGRSLGTTGDWMNSALDTIPRAIGLGPSVPREVVNQLNKRLGQNTMGWLNYGFSLVQLLQLPQMMTPEMIAVGGKLGMSPAEVTARTAGSMRLLPGLLKEAISGDGNLNPLMKGAYEEANKRGLLKFSEHQEVHSVTQSKVSKVYDKVADINRTLPEVTTRPAAFFMTVDMLKDSGLPPKEIYDIAYNATQSGMVDYHPSERPMMYSRLGVTGQLAGSLQTFKHAQLGQMYRMASKKQIAPLATSMVVGGAFAGITGSPFYNEADELVKFISDKFFDKPMTIREIALKGLPEWANSGVLSDATNMNWKSKLSAADVVPNSIPEAVSPFAGKIADTIGDTYALAKNRDQESARNLAMTLVPSGPAKGMLQDQIATVPASKASPGVPEGTVYGRDGKPGLPRTEWDRKVTTRSGMQSLDEALRKENNWQATMRDNANKAARTKIADNIRRDVRNGKIGIDPVTGQALPGAKEAIAKYKESYLKRKGDPSQFESVIVNELQQQKLNKQQRQQGINPTGVEGAFKYKNYEY